MNNLHRVGILALATFATACTTTEQTAVNTQQIGWLHGNCLAIKQADIPAASRFTVVHLDNEQHEEQAVITRPSYTTDTCYAQFANRAEVNKAAGYHFYQVRTQQPVNFAIGVLGKTAQRDKVAYTYCHTRDGIQFSAAQDGKTLWQGDYYLGYDALPTCKPSQ
ncbi:hypothetical protein JCM19237_1165 [Photobacterium aphoticum]|uniref:Lipoprotein n=1 Tax=Photobacterium aphoticum TaxID=754436 RepID=A0A090QQJ6_9GAMM|nr:hypothetical protein JCM19237_1165 [Photobacterium aphoticum]